MRDCDVGKVHIDGFYNLVVVISQLLKLEIKVIEPRDELYFRRVAANDNELLAKDSFDDKPAAVMLQSGLTKHLVEADILLFIESERILVTRSFGLLCSFLVSIHSFGLERRSTRENAPASQSSEVNRCNDSIIRVVTFLYRRIGNEKATVYFQSIARKYRISNNLSQGTKKIEQANFA